MLASDWMMKHSFNPHKSEQVTARILLSFQILNLDFKKIEKWSKNLENWYAKCAGHKD